MDNLDAAHGTIGPYRILEPLGQGAMGVVFRARRESDAADVALKTVQFPRASSLASIRREIHALSRLRHPRVVRVVDHGVHEGRVWYAMEHIEGPSLADRLGGTLAELLTLVHRLCEPLAYLHGEGLVHGDLKPANVLFRSVDEPVLVDLGLATSSAGASGREALAHECFEAAGTPDYMAPERIRAEPVDARADLYALGCILYAGLVGEPPFAQRRDTHAVLRAHLEHTPDPPSRWRPEVPPAVDQLVARLLAKTPRERLGHAEDVARAIESLGIVPLQGERAAAPRARPYLYRARFHGRGSALLALGRHLDAAHAGRPGVVVVAGESGVGKTRLVQELARTAAARGTPVIAGECQRPADRGEPLLPLRPLLLAAADRAVELGRDGAERVFGPHLRLLARYEPALLAVPGAERSAEPVELSGESARRRILAALDHVASALTERGPLVVLVDDLQWADELSIAWLAEVAREGGRARPLFVMATYRADEPSAGVEALLAGGAGQRIDLAGFDRDEVGTMVGEMLAMWPPPAPLVELVASSSDGNPFFVTEYLRAALDEGLLERHDGAWRLRPGAGERPLGQAPVSAAVDALLAGRIDRLSPRARWLAQAGAVIGRSFDQELLREVAGLDDEDVLDAMSTLLRQVVFEEAADGALRFAHDQLREASYQGLEPAARAALHRRVAEALVVRAGERRGPGPDALTLAHHWQLGGVADRAIASLEVAAATALASGTPEVAIEGLMRARELATGLAEPVAPGARARWARLEADAYFALGDLVSCERSCVEALAAAGIVLPESEAGWAWLFARAFGQQLLHQAVPRRLLVTRSRDPDVLENAALAAVRLSERHLYSGRPLPLAAASPLAVNLAERSGRPTRVSRAYAGTGFLTRVNKMGALSRRYFRSAEALAQVTADAEGLAFARLCQAAAAAGEGRWEDALAGIELGLAAASESMDEVQISTLETLRGHVEFFRGELAASRASFESVLASARRRGNAQHRAWGLVGIGRALAAGGARAAAVASFDEALGYLEVHPDFPVELMARGMLAAARASLGLLDSSIAEAARADAMIARTLPSLFATLSGYVGAAEAHLLACTIARENGQRAEAAAARARAGRSLRAVRLHALVFRVGQPARLRLASELARVDGDPDGAQADAEASAARAAALGMPIDEALARIALAELAHRADERERHRARALALLDACGARARWGGLV